jgi:hypothetical protein
MPPPNPSGKVSEGVMGQCDSKIIGAGILAVFQSPDPFTSSRTTYSGTVLALLSNCALDAMNHHPQSLIFPMLCQLLTIVLSAAQRAKPLHFNSYTEWFYPACRRGFARHSSSFWLLPRQSHRNASLANINGGEVFGLRCNVNFSWRLNRLVILPLLTTPDNHHARIFITTSGHCDMFGYYSVTRRNTASSLIAHCAYFNY